MSIRNIMAAILYCISVGNVSAEPLAVPRDCLSVFESTGSQIVDWKEMIQVEHCDRIKRLHRISNSSAGNDRVQFFNEIVSAKELGGKFGVDIPVLRVVFPERTFFDTDSAVLRSEAQEVVAIVAESLRSEPPDVSLFISGHADNRGDNKYNYNLSIDRSNALAEAVLESDVNVASVWRIGFGEDMPLVAGNSKRALAQNRRIEFLFAARPEALALWIGKQQIDLVCQAKSARAARKCKAKISPKMHYDALEVVPAQKVAVMPTRSEEAVDVNTKKIDVTPKRKKQTIFIRAPRKIRIDPINREVGEITTDTP